MPKLGSTRNWVQRGQEQDADQQDADEQDADQQDADQQDADQQDADQQRPYYGRGLITGHRDLGKSGVSPFVLRRIGEYERIPRP